MINENKEFCYRITHIDNLPLILQNAIVTKHHPNAGKNYIEIGNREIIQKSNFSKSMDDFDRPRRYQAEFLIHKEVPIQNVESLNVFDQKVTNFVTKILEEKRINLIVNIQP